MKKVWIVMAGWNETYGFSGVFSTEEKAIKWANRTPDEFTEIIEAEVDEPNDF